MKAAAILLTATVATAALPVSERPARITALVRRELARVLALPDGPAGIVDAAPFSGLGLDSLTSVELRNRLQRALGRPVGATAAFDWPSVAQLAAHLSALYDDAAREDVTL